MKIKYFTLVLTLFTSLQLFADEGQFHIYGKCSLVSQEVLEGFISFGDDRLWISEFSSKKLENPYAVLFSNNSQVLFGADKKQTPATHQFTCRYNDIRELRPIANNRLEVTVKGNRSIDVSYRFSKNPTIYLTDGTVKELSWEDIVLINFISSPNIAPKSYDKLYVGSVKSSQGVYFGIIEGRNYESTKRLPIAFTKEGEPDLMIEDVEMLDCEYGEHVRIKAGKNIGLYNIERRSNWGRVRIILPTIGSVEVPWKQLESITRVDSEQLSGSTYNSSTASTRLVGALKLRKEQTYNGPMAYDLDEALSIEFIEGGNDEFIYHLQFNAIASIEPRNYKYSLVTLKNGGRLSLGDYQDVTNSNDGVLMLNSSTYIPWEEIVLITFEPTADE